MQSPTTPEFNAEYRSLCTNVGHLFIAFARLEGVLTATLKLHLAEQMTNSASADAITLSSAIYGGMRFKASRDTIKRIMETEGTSDDTKQFVLSVFEQIAHIETLRDYIAHQQTVPAIEGPGHWQITDAATTKTIMKPKIHVFTVEAVSCAAADLITATDRLGGRVVGEKLFDNSDFDTSPVPWLYKSSMLQFIPLKKARDRLGPGR